MRIAIVHSYYTDSTPSGENIAVDSQAESLSRAGHDVVVIAQRTSDRSKSSLYPLEAGFTVATGMGRSPLPALRRLRPDVVHVHNLFPNWGTRWLSKWTGPLVATLHNYRPVCAAATLVRAGQDCRLCPDGDYLAAVRHRCYHSSAIESLAVAVAVRRGTSGRQTIRAAHRVVVVSPRAATIFRQYGLPECKSAYIPNFVDDPGARHARGASGDRWLFVGRVSAEKGLVELLREWPAEESLDVVGDGPELAAARAIAPAGVDFLGPRPHSSVVRSMGSYAGVVLPSRAPEGGVPLSALEAFAAGVPVVARRGNSAADVVASTGAGRVVHGATGWVSALKAVRENRSELGARARVAFERLFSEQQWRESMLRLYQDLV